MLHHCVRNIQALLSIQAQTKSQVYIFEVRKVIFVEASHLQKILSCIQGGCTAGAKYFFDLQCMILRAKIIAAPPAQSADMVSVASPIQPFWRVGLNLARSKENKFWICFCRAQ